MAHNNNNWFNNWYVNVLLKKKIIINKNMLNVKFDIENKIYYII